MNHTKEYFKWTLAICLLFLGVPLALVAFAGLIGWLTAGALVLGAVVVLLVLGYMLPEVPESK